MRAKKSLGQNFLGDDAVIRRIIDALDLRADETVIEIGPGKGALTRELVESGARVIAIEFDRDLIEPLQAKFGHRDNFELIANDALQIDFSGAVQSSKFQVPSSKLRSDSESEPGARNLELGTWNLEPGTWNLIKLVANLPYNLSTPILQRLTAQRSLFSRMVLMFQREVVERITAQPGGKSRGFLSVLVENAFHAEYLFDVPPAAFYPVPKVWSAVVRLTPKESSVRDESLLREILSASFAQKRKTLSNNLKVKYKNAAAVLEKSEIDGRRRAETLTLEEWVRLTAEVRVSPLGDFLAGEESPKGDTLTDITV